MKTRRIIGSEAFAYADHRLPPAHGALRRFSGRRGRRRRHLQRSWPLLFPLAAIIGMVIGRTI
jgi:hypothetical protein